MKKNPLEWGQGAVGRSLLPGPAAIGLRYIDS